MLRNALEPGLLGRRITWADACRKSGWGCTGLGLQAGCTEFFSKKSHYVYYASNKQLV